jgi:hypothetical protein
MSRLAAVHSGQPAQGIGAVPAVKPVPTRQYASPLEAQRVEAEAAEAAAGTSADPFPADSSTLLSPRSHYSAVRATAAAAWLSLTASELEVRKHFRSIPVQHGLETLARMRHQCNLAAETLQGRMDEGNQERCTGCGKTLEEVRKSQWIMMGSDMDPETGVPVPYRFCGPLCVRERNREKMLPKEERNKLRFDGQEEGEIR